MLSGELGVEFRHHDDGSEPGMPDLLSVDGNHVAEVITTARSAVRKAQQHLPPIPDPTLPHCVSVLIPYTIVGGTTKRVRQNIAADVLQRVAKAGCEYHWSSRDRRQSLEEVDPARSLVWSTSVMGSGCCVFSAANIRKKSLTRSGGP
jgi:hypothetical protein